jgi:hypothetical protein
VLARQRIGVLSQLLGTPAVATSQPVALAEKAGKMMRSGCTRKHAGWKRGRDSFYAAPGPRPTSEAIKSRRIRVASPFAPCGAFLPEQEMKVTGHHAVSQKEVRASEITCSNAVKCGWFSKT